ncbi:AraC family transcriptional regulator [Mangrovihabitans endophyticus]|uniref:AraC family transcriptional regulator n=1 Tax=Mangrovihabitans endophyticus TaxID=1751298 RepID=A0A8J3BYZ4_9ACTN|nr:helix-turn-helix domain-containing protein [Mangrovihabitans endophyticus]GGK85370.1 AraC family transcriptional regulator [Mangrovihabitans endophyticus]
MAVREFVRSRPSPALRPLVGWYTGYREAGVPPRIHRGLPSPYLTLIITLDDPVVIAAHPDASQPPGRYPTLIGGLHRRPALIAHQGRQSGIQVAVHPLGCRHLFGLPAAELVDLDLDFAAVAGEREVATMRDELVAARGWPQRFAVLDRHLCQRRDDQRPGVDTGVTHAYRRILATGGRVRIGSLAAETGWSARHLNNRFRAETGMRLKETARTARFDTARRLLATGSGIGRAAADAGYSDQAHLTREFRDFAGCTPTRWWSEEVGFLQDSGLPGDEDR